MQVTSQHPQELERSLQEITRPFSINAADKSLLQAGSLLHLTLKRMAQEQKIDGFAAECWSGFPRELGLNPCLGFIEDAYTLACEGDVLLCISLLAARYLSSASAYAGDLYDLGPGGRPDPDPLRRSRFTGCAEERSAAGAFSARPERGFETLTCRPRLNPGPVTLFRFYGRGCDQLHLAAGELLSSEQSPNLTVKIRLNGDRWEFLEKCFGNHYVVARRRSAR